MNQNFIAGANLALQAYGIYDARQRQAMMEKLYASQMETAAQQRELGAIQLGETKRKIAAGETFRKGVEEGLKVPPQPIDFPGMTYGMIYGPEAEMGVITEEYRKAKPEEYYEERARALMKGQEPYTLAPGAGRYVGPKLIAERPIEQKGADYKIVKDEISSTKWSYQHITDPTKIIRNAPPPSTEAEKNANIHFETDEEGNTIKIVSHPITGKTISKENMGKIGKGIGEKYTTQQQIDDLRQVYEKEKSIIDAKHGVSFDPITKMIVGLDPMKRQDYMNDLTALQQRYNKIAKIRGIKEPIFPVAGYGTPRKLDEADIITLKQFSTPDEALSHVERAHRAGMITDEEKNEAISLVNQNRKQWDNWRRPGPLPPGQELIPSHVPLPISPPGTVIKPLYPVYPGLGEQMPKPEYKMPTMEEQINNLTPEKRKRFEEKMTSLQKKYPYKTKREIQEYILTLIEYEEE